MPPPSPQRSLLVHLTFYDRAPGTDAWERRRQNLTVARQAHANDPTQLTDAWSGWPFPWDTSANHVLKSDWSWREHIFGCLQASLSEMEARYTMFTMVQAVVDVNAENEFVDRLRAFAAANLTHRVRLEVRRASSASQIGDRPLMKLDAPFDLSWVHRDDMERRLSDYDWFMYAEEDTLVPAAAMQEAIRLAEPLYNATGRTLGFVRTVKKDNGREFYADMRRYVPRAWFFRLPGLGVFASPTFPFSAAWAYPRVIMRDFVSDPQWRAVGKDVRASAAAGFRECGARARARGLRTNCSVLTAAPHRLRVIHLAHCGKYYHKTPATATPFGRYGPPDLGKWLARGGTLQPESSVGQQLLSQPAARSPPPMRIGRVLGAPELLDAPITADSNTCPGSDDRAGALSDAHLLVSIASVPPRFHLLPEVVRRLQTAQDRPPDETLLIFARRYRNFDISDAALNATMAATAARGARSYVCEDSGPITKLFGALQHLQVQPLAQRERTVLVTVDDDFAYPPWLLSNLLHHALRHPSAVVAHTGGIYHGRPQTPQAFLRNGMQGLTYYGANVHRDVSIAWCTVKPVNYLYGYAGVAYRPAFFRQALFARAPWLTDQHKGCWHCDDQYISGTLREAGVPVFAVPTPGDKERAIWNPATVTSAARGMDGARPCGDACLLQIGRLLMRFNESVWQPPDRAACGRETPICDPARRSDGCVCVLRAADAPSTGRRGDAAVVEGTPARAPRDLFIGYATGASAPDVVRLARALQYHAPQSHLALFVHAADRPRLRRCLEACCNASAVWLLPGSDANISRGPSPRWEEPGVPHAHFLKQRSRAVDNIRRKHLNYVATIRFFHVRRFLVAHRALFDRVIMADTRDVALQADPFAQITLKHSVYAFTESTRYDTFGMHGFNPTVVRECYGSTFLERISKDKVVNCGVLMGYSGAMIGYLNAFVAEFDRVGPCGATDTALNVKVLYDHVGASIVDGDETQWSALLQQSEHSATIHMALPRHWESNALPADRLNLTRLRPGDVITNLRHAKYALIHQADRLGGVPTPGSQPDCSGKC